MSTTNHTTNYELSQYIGTDVTSYLSNYNSDMYKIDAQMKVNATAAAAAQSDASAAVSAATSAASSASAAVSTANAANTAAEAAQTAATAAQTAAGTAETDAAAALKASASNTIGNLAPAYDPTLTYSVGDLVTYVDPETNQGKLYKNIIPITTPEKFNINKWDDVTTSEVYGRKGELLYSVVADGVKTWTELLGTIGSNIVLDTNSEYMLEINYSNATLFIHTRYISTTDAYFVDTAPLSNNVNISRYVISSNPSHVNAKSYTIGYNELVITDFSSDAPTDITIKLYKQYTV